MSYVSVCPVSMAVPAARRGGERVVVDAAEFDAFYVGTRRRLMVYLYSLTGSTSDAEEIMQEAYARAWQHWRRVARYDDPEAWVRTVAWRISNNRWRKLQNSRVAARRHGPVADTPAPSTDTVLLVQGLRQLPEDQRRAIVLHHPMGLSVDDVARETGCPTGTVKARLSRGRAALATLLGDLDGGRDG
jgi:RNA polymerase sigma-70 factor (ECF subfamily)